MKKLLLLALLLTACSNTEECDCVKETYTLENYDNHSKRTIISIDCVEQQPEQWHIQIKDNTYYNIKCEE